MDTHPIGFIYLENPNTAINEIKLEKPRAWYAKGWRLSPFLNLQGFRDWNPNLTLADSHLVRLPQGLKCIILLDSPPPPSLEEFLELHRKSHCLWNGAVMLLSIETVFRMTCQGPASSVFWSWKSLWAFHSYFHSPSLIEWASVTQIIEFLGREERALRWNLGLCCLLTVTAKESSIINCLDLFSFFFSHKYL